MDRKEKIRTNLSIFLGVSMSITAVWIIVSRDYIIFFVRPLVLSLFLLTLTITNWKNENKFVFYSLLSATILNVFVSMMCIITQWEYFH